MQGISTKESRSVVGSTSDAGQEAGSSQEVQGAGNDVHGWEEVANRGSARKATHMQWRTSSLHGRSGTDQSRGDAREQCMQGRGREDCMALHGDRILRQVVKAGA
jgi:hypothetical protein